MSCYENLVMKTQMNYSGHYSTYASGGTAVVLSKQKPLPYEEQIQEFVRRVQEAEFADYFFDGFVVDWMVQDRINNARHQVEEAIRRTEYIINQLQHM